MNEYRVFFQIYSQHKKLTIYERLLSTRFWIYFYRKYRWLPSIMIAEPYIHLCIHIYTFFFIQFCSQKTFSNEWFDWIALIRHEFMLIWFMIFSTILFVIHLRCGIFLAIPVYIFLHTHSLRHIYVHKDWMFSMEWQQIWLLLLLIIDLNILLYEWIHK